MKVPFVAGQRWVSESEPELGLALVLSCHDGRVTVTFPASEETRTYSADNAPLRRMRLRLGDTVQTLDGRHGRVDAIQESAGVLCYAINGETVSESQLSHHTSSGGPEDRLLSHQFGAPAAFDLRRHTLEAQARMRQSAVRGFVGGRIDLIPHQLYIAREVSRRHTPRVLLSDEVGLGKTIEAGLILHRLLLSGRVERVLIVVPESLMHQWFAELLRRFNLWFDLYDEDRCTAIEKGDPGINPFLDDQLILLSIDFLDRSPHRAAQAVAAGWDMLVVDEAHHLEWSEDAPSRRYEIVEALSRRTPGMLLLTATPEQLGVASHFARLRLLDPDRYSSLVAFESGARDYRPAAELAERLAGGKELRPADLRTLEKWLSHVDSLDGRLQQAASNADHREFLLTQLLDLHGPGRVIFRNTRAGMQGFPKRIAVPVALAPGDDAETWIDRVSTEFAVDAGDSNLSDKTDLSQDPRLLWLVQWLRENENTKVLLICRRLEKVEAIEAALRRHLNLKVGVFHEKLTLVQRDRQAAWFADPDGARILLCSEIGSEGRNFQFAHHLVLFDLPLNPELLEQRIGRLDRIGQIQDIRIHAPYLRGSPQEVLWHWYHEGLDAFETNLEGGQELLREFGRRVHDLAMEFPASPRSDAEPELRALVRDTRTRRREIRELLKRGRDRLLELNSFRPPAARELIDLIRTSDQDADCEAYMLEMFDHYGVHIEELAPRTWFLNPRGVLTDAFPSIPEDGLTATADRLRALSREDVAFLTWDHPMVAGAMELLLGSETGSCSFGVLPTPGDRTLLLESCFVLETIAANRWHADRFLPATPIRVVINHKFDDVTAAHPTETFDGRLRPGNPHKLVSNADIAKRILPAMVEKSHQVAANAAASLRGSALAAMTSLIAPEIARIRTLSHVNDHVRPEEIEAAETEERELSAAIQNARLRLDCVRLIWKGAPETLAR